MSQDKFIISPRGAAEKNTVVSVRMPDRTLRQLESIAGKTGRSRNELILMCIDYALSHLEITEE